MIPISAIMQHRERAPWRTNQMVEQDLLICRALVAIYSDEFLAKRLVFRGGALPYISSFSHHSCATARIWILFRLILSL